MPVSASFRTIVVVALAAAGAVSAHGQAAAEYGAMTANSAGATAAVKVPFPNITLPGSTSNAPAAPPTTSTYLPAGAAEAAAEANRQYLQDHSGPDAAQISVHSVPDHAHVYVDTRFVGDASLNLKLAPGRHQVVVRAANMQESTLDLDLKAKQTQSIEVPMKSRYQNQVAIHWPSQK
jgi:hypothetical protein